MAGFKDKVVIVTGGTGFIGGKLVEKLIEGGARVIAADIALDSHSLFIINGLHKESKFEVADVRRISDVKNLFERYNPDYVFHLAAQTLVTTAYDNPVETFETNIIGTVNLLELARRSTKIKSIIVASSDKAYGKTEKAYIETYPLNGDHPYDVSKSSADLICQTYFKTYKTPVIVTRFGNVYGEGDLHFDRIIPGICKSIIKNETLYIRSDGKYIRDYLYVDDVASGYLFLLNQGEKAHGEAFNFSSEDKLSVVELINKISSNIGSKIEYKILNTAKNEIPFQHLNDTKIRKLGWKNQYSIDNVMPQIVEWYKKIL